MAVKKRVVLHFPSTLVDQPIMCQLAKEFNIDFNILKAAVTPKEEGLLVVELSGVETDYDNGMAYLAQTGVRIQPLSKDVVRDDQKCIHCGACVVLCPSDALVVDRTTMEVRFDDGQCIACEICVRSCPTRAMEIHF